MALQILQNLSASQVTSIVELTRTKPWDGWTCGHPRPGGRRERERESRASRNRLGGFNSESASSGIVTTRGD